MYPSTSSTGNLQIWGSSKQSTSCLIETRRNSALKKSGGNQRTAGGCVIRPPAFALFSVHLNLFPPSSSSCFVPHALLPFRFLLSLQQVVCHSLFLNSRFLVSASPPRRRLHVSNLVDRSCFIYRKGIKKDHLSIIGRGNCQSGMSPGTVALLTAYLLPALILI